MENVIVVLILFAIVGLAARYVYKAKKSGKKCIGCPDSGACGSSGSTCSGSCASCSCCCGTKTE